MAKMLNLDELTKTNRTVKIRGNVYEVQEMTVGNFIETMKESKRLESESDPVEQMNATIGLLRRCIPDVPQDVLRSLPVEHLTVLLDFVQNEIGGAEGSGEEKGEEGEGTEKKE